MSGPVLGSVWCRCDDAGQPSAALPRKSTSGLAGRKAGRPPSAGDFPSPEDRFVPKDRSLSRTTRPSPQHVAVITARELPQYMIRREAAGRQANRLTQIDLIG